MMTKVATTRLPEEPLAEIHDMLALALDVTAARHRNPYPLRRVAGQDRCMGKIVLP